MDIISKILNYLKKRQKLVNNVCVLFFVVALLFSIGFTLYYRGLHEDQISSMHQTAISNEALTSQNTELNEEVIELKNKITEYESKIEQLQTELETEQQKNAQLLKNAACSVTYPDKQYLQATYVWNYLKNEISLNDYVAAGVLGNIMTEVGGQTLDISKYSCRESNGGTYYGMCQWAGPRKERLLNDFGRSLEDQCRFLKVELFEIIPENNSFYDLQDEQEAALYFAKKYERCATWSYSKRQVNATKALQYFTSTAE